MTKPFNFIDWGLDRILIKNIIVGIITLLVGTCIFLLYRLDEANQRAQDSDKRLAETERFCSQEMQKIYREMFAMREQVYEQIERSKAVEKIIKKR
jgi:hypothetical protein